MGIVNLENILIVVEKRAADDKFRDPLNYHFTLIWHTRCAQALGVALRRTSRIA